MIEKVKVAGVQLNASPEISENTKIVEDQVREAAGQGAKLIVTPENTCHMVFPQGKKLDTAPAEDAHGLLSRAQELAQELDVWLLLGSLSIKVQEDKIANRSFMISDKGEIVARYDKIHLFDVDLAGGESYRESKNVQGGDKAVLADTPWGKVGMTICYDVRFPHLYRTLAHAGASILTVPAAFTVPTGKAHWHTLLRARAIENGAFVIATGQCGTHAGDRLTYGHSLIINPWGEVIAEAGEQPEIIYADLDMDEVTKARESIPALQHDRPFELV